MNTAVLLCIGLLGGVGAVGRFLLDGGIAGRLGRDFPYGTLAVNVLGSLLLGVLVGAALSGDAYRLAATGLVGASPPSAPGRWRATGSARTASCAPPSSTSPSASCSA